MSLAISLIRSPIRHFSARASSKPETRIHRFIAASCIASGVVVPFIPPALESSSSREKGLEETRDGQYPPLCFHAR